MTVTVNNSISADGYICGPNGEEEWISEADEKYFEKACEEADLIILGSGTFDANDGLFPISGTENIVFTSRAKERGQIEGITFSDEDPVNFVKKHSDKKILVAGGGKLNASLLKAGVVNEVITAIHPVILGYGTRQFEGIDFNNYTELEKKSFEDIGDGVILVKYAIKN